MYMLYASNSIFVGPIISISSVLSMMGHVRHSQLHGSEVKQVRSVIEQLLVPARQTLSIPSLITLTISMKLLGCTMSASATIGHVYVKIHM
jgi:hypothetical protein